MKKTNIPYTVGSYGVAIIAVIALLILNLATDDNIYLIISTVGIIVILITVPILIDKNLDKKSAELSKNFPYQMSFKTKNGIFYFNPTDGRVAVVWKYNPFELQEIDVSKVTDVRTHDGKQLRGTSLVSCQFKLNGKKIKIYTLRVSNGQLSMKDPRVLEAISKADQIGEMLIQSKKALQ